MQGEKEHVAQLIAVVVPWLGQAFEQSDLLRVVFPVHHKRHRREVEHKQRSEELQMRQQQLLYVEDK